MGWEDSKKTVEGIFRGLGSGAFNGTKLGPGLLGNLAVVAIALFFCLAIVAWATSHAPWILLACVALILAFALYLIERLVRFAEKYPAAALLGGTEFYHHLKDQSAAKDPKVVGDDRIASGGPTVIEHRTE